MLFKLHWIIICLFVAFLYVKYIVRSPLYSASNIQITYLSVALSIFILLKATPIDVIGTHYLFSMHTLQLSLTYFVVIPLLLLSLPTDLLRQYIWHHHTRLLLRILAHPWLTLIAFNGLISVYYIPTVFNFIHAYPILDVLAQNHFICERIFHVVGDYQSNSRDERIKLYNACIIHFPGIRYFNAYRVFLYCRSTSTFPFLYSNGRGVDSYFNRGI